VRSESSWRVQRKRAERLAMHLVGLKGPFGTPAFVVFTGFLISRERSTPPSRRHSVLNRVAEDGDSMIGFRSRIRSTGHPTVLSYSLFLRKHNYHRSRGDVFVLEKVCLGVSGASS